MPAFERPSAMRPSTSRSRGRQVSEWVVAAPGADELVDESRIHDRSSPDDSVEALQKVGHVGHPALQQVAGSLASRKQVNRLVDLHVSGQHDDAGVRHLGADHPGGIKPLGLMVWRHANVDDDQVRLAGANELEQLRGVARLTNDLEARPLEQAGDAFAKEHVIIRNGDARQGHRGDHL